MARDLKTTIQGFLGPRKVLKYFSQGGLGVTADGNILDEFVASGLRELAETVPFRVTVSNLAPDLYNRLTDASLAAVGPRAARYLAIDELWFAAVSPAAPFAIPLARRVLNPTDRLPQTSSGYIFVPPYIFLPGSGTPFYQAPASSPRYYVHFKVIPTESELAGNSLLLRSAALFGAAAALEEISGAALRETFVRLQGLPENHADTKNTHLEIDFLRKRACALLGDYQAANFQ